MAHILMKDMPVIIDGTGTYVTRCGFLVTVDEIGCPSRSAFNAKGNYWAKAGKRLVPHFSIWHPSGCFEAIRRDHPYDIVRKATDEEAQALVAKAKR